jgi:hypothetical protein
MSAEDKQTCDMINEISELFKKVEDKSDSIDKIFRPLEIEVATKSQLAHIMSGLFEGSISSLLSVKERVGTLINGLIADQLEK